MTINVDKAKEFIEKIDKEEHGQYWSNDPDLLAKYFDRYANIILQEERKRISKVFDDLITSRG